ncbi:caspase domain-containing protein [Dissophora ornata]|nr:caspase domain-containing protein [Dissophora ornata]
MSQPQEVGEPIVNVEKVVTVMPDGRTVTKTIKKITHSYQVQVPAGTPVPAGAQVSTFAAEAPMGSTVTYQSSSYNSNQGDSGSFMPQSNLSNVVHQQYGSGDAKTEPTVVVQSTIGEDGRKVTKTTTTTSSSSGSPFSKLFKRFSQSSKSKPLPSVPAPQPVVQAQPAAQVHHVIQPAVKIQQAKPLPTPAKEPEPVPESKPIRATEFKNLDGIRVPLSDCTGKRRALLIGINYTGRGNQLHGCVNDTAVMKAFLLEVGFPKENIRVLTDDQVGTPWLPTRENILNNLKWLIHGAQKNDSYFLHYSGHGGQVPDRDGDETDGMDDCIFPMDHEENGVIIDDDLHSMLVRGLPVSVRLTVVFDCCHSGSALDLPYIYTSTGYIRGSNALTSLGHELVEVGFDENAIKELQKKWEKLQIEEKELARQIKLKAVDTDVVMFSGCQDDQTSADVSITRGGKSSSNGAMTYAFTKCIRENPEQSYEEMLGSIRDLLKEKYRQKPQLSSSRLVNTKELFHM